MWLAKVISIWNVKQQKLAKEILLWFYWGMLSQRVNVFLMNWEFKLLIYNGETVSQKQIFENNQRNYVKSVTTSPDLLWNLLNDLYEMLDKNNWVKGPICDWGMLSQSMNMFSMKCESKLLLKESFSVSDKINLETRAKVWQLTP